MNTLCILLLISQIHEPDVQEKTTTQKRNFPLERADTACYPTSLPGMQAVSICEHQAKPA